MQPTQYSNDSFDLKETSEMRAVDRSESFAVLDLSEQPNELNCGEQPLEQPKQAKPEPETQKQLQ